MISVTIGDLFSMGKCKYLVIAIVDDEVYYCEYDHRSYRTHHKQQRFSYESLPMFNFCSIFGSHESWKLA